MSNAVFSLDLKTVPVYTISHEGLEVVIQPLNKREDKKLTDQYTKGKMTIIQSRGKRGFRTQGKDEITLPDIDFVGLNTEKAVRTWKSWNLCEDKEGKKAVPCNPENIQALFERYYDKYASPIMSKLEEEMGLNEDENEEEDPKESGKR